MGIEGWHGIKSLYNIKHDYYVIDTKIPDKADKNGVYEWTWAPRDQVFYNFWKKGYEPLQGQPFTADGTECEIKIWRGSDEASELGPFSFVPANAAGNQDAEQDKRIEAALNVLRNYKITEDIKTWAGAIRELIKIGKPAVPKLVDELDRTERNETLRAWDLHLGR